MHFSKNTVFLSAILAAISDISLGATFYFWEHSECLLGSHKEPKKVGFGFVLGGYKGTPISSPTESVNK